MEKNKKKKQKVTERKGKPAPGRLRSVPAASSWLPFHLLFNSGARFAQQPLRKKKNNNNNTNNTHLTEDSSSRRYIPRLILPCVRLLLLKRRKSHQSGLRFVRLIPPNVKRRVRGSRQASSPESAPGRSVGRSGCCCCWWWWETVGEKIRCGCLR